MRREQACERIVAAADETDLAAPMDTGDPRALPANSDDIFARYGPLLRALDQAAGQDAEKEGA